MRIRLFPSIPQSLTVFVFWVLMAEDYSAGTLLMGALLGFLMPQIAARLEREFARLDNLWLLIPLAFKLLYDIVVANITVAVQVLGPEKKLCSGFLWIPLELTNIHGISALTTLITITPGTVSAELSRDRKHLLVHCLDIDDPQAMIDKIKSRYESPMRKVFP
jgi:multicomponent K+:H+ antiporter subunit E